MAGYGVFQSSPSSSDLSPTSITASKIFGSQLRFLEIELSHLRISGSLKSLTLRAKASSDSTHRVQKAIDSKPKVAGSTDEASHHFEELRQRFLGFKQDIFLKNLDHYQKLSDAQAPKFMVIACADSRVCPSRILGFQPGEAFVVRNVANLVPPHESGPLETNAALEFAVNSLEVENILVIGHSCCGGIKALMSMEDDDLTSSSFIENWVVVGKPARVKTKAAALNLGFDQQCRHCEKESINRSLVNLLTYPWIEERVMRGKLSIHGGYYDFINCTFEKWTLDYYGGSSKSGDSEYGIKNRELWT
ncbi:carbonic anhydrase 2-like isoform X2 [Andrographis paniculata]|uniref:carbonic anhydrase 2-like isoform X2 n=1 Tax=Andrographis paniculata TaxID=175694 RepID=UPI0021E830D9|nr:carbonic anhydrase 2-like isoform X2 [Andrographis paniculata]